MFKKLSIIALCALAAQIICAQRVIEKQYVTVAFVPNHADWCYATGEQVELEISVRKHYVAMPGQTVKIEWGMEKNEPEHRQTINTGKSGTATLRLKGSDVPGFKTCTATVEVDGRKYTNYINLGFAPDRIEPTTQLPADFKEFWAKAIADARRVPLEPMMTRLPHLDTPHATVYHVRFQNHKKARYFYAILAVPKGDGPFPVAIRMPGAGVRKLNGYTNFFPEHGIATLQIGIHGIPLDQEPQIYSDLRENALKDYQTSHNDDRDKYYYKRVYTGCVKAVDFLCTLPFIDSTRIGVCGGSQGGALSVVLAGLDERIKCVAATYPALAEIAGTYHGRAGGWPGIFKNPNEAAIEQKVKVSEYYDVVNFARFVKAPMLFTLGYNDAVCCPTSTYSAYNTLVCPKQLLTPLDCGHWDYKEQDEQQDRFMLEELKK